MDVKVSWPLVGGWRSIINFKKNYVQVKQKLTRRGYALWRMRGGTNKKLEKPLNNDMYFDVNLIFMLKWGILYSMTVVEYWKNRMLKNVLYYNII